MTPGSLSIKSEAGPWSKPEANGYLAVAAVGVLAGIAVAYARMPLHLPGHKALWWIPPVLAARLLTRCRLGASVGAIATVLTTLSLGGRMAGGAAGAPLVALAGVVLDLAAGCSLRLRSGRWSALLLLGSAGAIGNLICFTKRLFESNGTFLPTATWEELWRAAATHLVFGFAAGALAALMTAVAERLVQGGILPRRRDPQPGRH